MSESLFWQDGFPKSRRAELVANLLYSGDPNARIPNNEGLRPERIDDFYEAVGFTSLGDLDDRLGEIEARYRYGDPAPEEISISTQEPIAPRALPSADPFEKFFAVVEKPVVAAPEVKIRRPRKPRAIVPEQLIIPVPSHRIEAVVEAPIVETASVLPTADVPSGVVLRASRPPTPEVHAEDRVSAFARGVLAWFSRTPRGIVPAETEDDRVDMGRMREVVEELFAKELAGNARDGKVHVEAANRLERAVATSAHLEPGARATMKERITVLRSTYEGRMQEIARSRRGELQAGIDAIVAQERDDADSAIRILAMRTGSIVDDVAQFRGQIEHLAVQRDGAEVVAAVDKAFQDAWRNAWTGAVTPIDIGPLEESLPRLRLLEESSRSGVTQMVVAARASVQEEIDRRLPRLEREMRRTA